jgi:hypothetical protein
MSSTAGGMMGVTNRFDKLGKTYFEFYRTIAPSTETRAWEELPKFARRLWVRTAILHTPSGGGR